MDFIYHLFPQNILHALGWTVLHSLWQAFLVALFLAAYLLLSKKKTARSRYLAGCTAMCTTLLLSIFTFLFLLNKGGHAAGFNEEQGVIEGNLVDSIQLISSSSFHSYFTEHIPLIVTAWLIGMLFFILKTLGGLLYIQRLRTKHLSAVPASWAKLHQQLHRQLNIKMPVKLSVSLLVKAPVVVGWLKPIILMPIAAVNQLSLEQVEAILAHELAHVARYDYLINILQTIVEALFYFNPAVWWISSNIRLERESCCDDLAVQTCGNSIAYAKALVALQEMHPVPTSTLALSFSQNKQQLLHRIQRILKSPDKKSNVMEKISVTVLLLFTVVLLSFKTHSQEPISTDNTSESALVNSDHTASLKVHPTKDSLPNHIIKKITGPIKVVMKNGDVIEIELAEDMNGEKPVVQSVTHNGVPVSPDDYDQYDLENINPNDIATIDVSPKKQKDKGQIRIHKKDNGKEIELMMKDGDIKHLEIDGKKIAAADYPKYQNQIDELVNDLPPAPPAPPMPPKAPAAVAPIAPPSPPSAIPAPPAPPAPVAPRVRTITSEKNGKSMTFTIESTNGEDPVLLEIKNKKKGKVKINGRRIKGLKDGEKAVIIQDLNGKAKRKRKFWDNSNQRVFWLDEEPEVAIAFPEISPEVEEALIQEHGFIFPNNSNTSEDLWAVIADENRLNGVALIDASRSAQELLLKDYEVQQMDLFEHLEDQKRRTKWMKENEELLRELEARKAEEHQLLRGKTERLRMNRFEEGRILLEKSKQAQAWEQLKGAEQERYKSNLAQQLDQSTYFLQDLNNHQSTILALEKEIAASKELLEALKAKSSAQKMEKAH